MHFTVFTTVGIAAVLLVAFGMPETRPTSTEAAGEADLEAVARRDSCRGKSR